MTTRSNLAVAERPKRWRKMRQYARRVLLGALIVQFAASAPALAGEHEEASAKLPVPANLVGSWHSASIDGDALFLVVYGFQVDFFEGGEFHAHVAFTDGQKREIKGLYRIEPGNKMVFEVPKSKLREVVKFSFKGKDKLRIEDPSYGVRIFVNRGKAKKKSGDDWF